MNTDRMRRWHARDKAVIDHLADKAFQTLRQPRCKATKPDDSHRTVSSETGTEEMGPQKAWVAGFLSDTRLTGAMVFSLEGISLAALVTSQELLIYVSSNDDRRYLVRDVHPERWLSASAAKSDIWRTADSYADR